MATIFFLLETFYCQLLQLFKNLLQNICYIVTILKNLYDEIFINFKHNQKYLPV